MEDSEADEDEVDEDEVDEEEDNEADDMADLELELVDCCCCCLFPLLFSNAACSSLTRCTKILYRADPFLTLFTFNDELLLLLAFISSSSSIFNGEAGSAMGESVA